jgi:hypothetical protein
MKMNKTNKNYKLPAEQFVDRQQFVVNANENAWSNPSLYLQKCSYIYENKFIITTRQLMYVDSNKLCKRKNKLSMLLKLLIHKKTWQYISAQKAASGTKLK